MTQHTFIAAAALALACSTSAFANDTSSGKAGTSGGAALPSAGATAQCDNLTGTKKAQCMQQAQQRQGSGSAVGGTIGSAAGSVVRSCAQPNDAAPSEGAAGTAGTTK